MHGVEVQCLFKLNSKNNHQKKACLFSPLVQQPQFYQQHQKNTTTPPPDWATKKTPPHHLQAGSLKKNTFTYGKNSLTNFFCQELPIWSHESEQSLQSFTSTKPKMASQKKSVFFLLFF